MVEMCFKKMVLVNYILVQMTAIPLFHIFVQKLLVQTSIGPKLLVQTPIGPKTIGPNTYWPKNYWSKHMLANTRVTPSSLKPVVQF